MLVTIEMTSFVEIFSPCPTISPVNIGIIGKTQGVNDNRIPAIKNKKMLTKIVLLYSRLLIEI